jgi:hypothetical protein
MRRLLTTSSQAGNEIGTKVAAACAILPMMLSQSPPPMCGPRPCGDVPIGGKSCRTFEPLTRLFGRYFLSASRTSRATMKSLRHGTTR